MRKDPFLTFNFLVEIDGILAGGFTDVSGMDLTTEVDSIREGGLNDFVHKLPKWTTQSDLVLKKGITDKDLLWDWYFKVVSGNVQRKNFSVILLDVQRKPVMWWDFADAYPIKWSGPELDASRGTVASESLTLVHHGLMKLTKSQQLPSN